MYERLRRSALAILRVPPEPHAPMGDPASLRVFNAGRNYFRLRLAGWAVTQALALAGFIFWTAFLLQVEKSAAAQKAARENPPAETSNGSQGDTPANAGSKRRRDTELKRAGERIGKASVEVGKDRKKGKAMHPWAGFKQAGVEVALILPAGAFFVIWGLKILSFLIYTAQIPLTYAVRRLDYEMRWYMVTDRSLRLRSGVWKVSEATMSFANIQQVAVSQGPLQRLLGLSDLKVQSAGGGSGGPHHHGNSDMHTGLFHNVTNAEEIRDLILERLRRFREAGLGDPEDKGAFEEVVSAMSVPGPSDALTAVRELAAEARALRAAIISQPV